jgi:hypothetical protein
MVVVVVDWVGVGAGLEVQALGVELVVDISWAYYLERRLV